MTSRPAAPKHQSSTSTPVAKPQCKIHPTAVVADKAQITGSYVVEIGENSIIHPHAKIKAEYGNVVIGKGCVIAEKAVAGVAEKGQEDGNGKDGVDVVLGEGVSVETSAVVEARKVGDWTDVGVGARIGRDAVVGKWCKIAPKCEVRAREVLEDFTVVFGEGNKGRRVDGVLKERKEVRDARVRGRVMEMEVLRGCIADGKVKWTMG